ncbi:F0F1 ATP synthase subunit C [Williamsoniiplasma luminosum]|uniref:ATP synthase subunit c n=2 Tax=Williamsoniiplasma luminosum TaxID=214888 RepID=A0A2K8NSQ5_9MOLU|nr:ATP synthase subunit C [Williamsoniiplasma luminosum]ATZ16829.1 F0F1 ATP synthase subunit C [Williamsoniiplasma luminosum]
MLLTGIMTDVYASLFMSVMAIMPNLFAEGQATTDIGIGVGLKYLGAGVAAIGVLGAGIGQGIVGQGACLAIGRNPEMASKITSTMIIAAGIAESGAIYALVIAVLLAFVVN